MKTKLASKPCSPLQKIVREGRSVKIGGEGRPKETIDRRAEKRLSVKCRGEMEPLAVLRHHSTEEA